MDSNKKSFICKKESDTQRLASLIAQVCHKGDVFALYGTLGAGKSTFSRYFIQHFIGNIDVPSPTFTLVQTYSTNDFDIYHYDMYRLKHPDEAYELGIDEAFYNAVNLIEWPENIEALLPRNAWKIRITTNESCRVFEIIASNKEQSNRLQEIAFE
jgi:tRNA threonylcarbamoyladenosine biosynthesis protein TsaE